MGNDCIYKVIKSHWEPMVDGAFFYRGMSAGTGHHRSTCGFLNHEYNNNRAFSSTGLNVKVYRTAIFFLFSAQIQLYFYQVATGTGTLAALLLASQLV